MHDLQRPLTDLQALMEAQPYRDEANSAMGIQPLREAVADCLDALSPLDRYLLEATHTERATVRDMAERVGYHKSYTYRLVKRAEVRLRDECLQHPVVLAYLGVDASIVPRAHLGLAASIVPVAAVEVSHERAV